MRLSHRIASAAALALALISCSRESRVPDGGDQAAQQSGTYSFRAVLEAPVRTSVDSEGKVSWTAGDEIAVWDEKGARYCNFVSAKDDGVFCFQGEPGVSYSFTKAVYPASIAKDAGTISLPDAYSLEEASSGNSCPMLAYPDSQEPGVLRFRHLGAVLRYTVVGVPSRTTSLVLSSAEASLSGDFSFAPQGLPGGIAEGDGEDITSGGELPVKSSEGSGVVIHSAAGSGTVTVALEPGTRRDVTLYLPVPLGAYSCTLTVKEGDETIVSHTTATLKDIKRSKMVQLSSIASIFESGTGTQEDPYLIEIASDLSLMSSLCSDPSFAAAYYKLVADIDMSGEESFKPIGGSQYATRFTGVLDGDGHTIRNLSVSSASYAGLFGYLGGTVKNLIFEKAAISSAGNYAAVVAATMAYATVEHCRVDALSSVSAGGIMAGSIAGLVRAGTIDACASHASVSATRAAGGIAGGLNPISKGQNCLVINCTYDPVYMDGKLSGACLQTSADVAYMGGIAGAASFYKDLGSTVLSSEDARIEIVNCYAYPLEMASTRTVSTTVYHIGGILGRADGATTVLNCFSPVTYSNILRSGTRLNASNNSTLTSTAAIVGRVYTTGVTVSRTFSSRAWQKACGNPGSVEYNHSLNTVHLGAPNMRGYGSTFLNGTEYKEADGGLAAALNAGVQEWNAGSPAVAAFEWAYDPTHGYPKPQGVDVPGVVTRKVSVIGDSISTYEGFMFSNDNYHQSKHYPNTGGSSTEKADWAPQVHNEQLTWWWRLIYDKMTNARLEVNSAWGGTTVSYLTEKTEHSANPSASCQVNSLQGRYRDYGLGNPDVLFYFGGRNDYAAVGGNSLDLLGDYSTDSLQVAYDAPSPALYNNYSQGTVAILKHFHDAHPDAKIMIMITDLMTDEYEDSAEAIRAFLEDKGYDIKFANLHKRGTTNKQNNDIGVIKEKGSHPNATGCENIANYIWEQLGGWLDN